MRGLMATVRTQATRAPLACIPERAGFGKLNPAHSAGFFVPVMRLNCHTRRIESGSRNTHTQHGTPPQALHEMPD